MNIQTHSFRIIEVHTQFSLHVKNHDRSGRFNGISALAVILLHSSINSSALKNCMKKQTILFSPKIFFALPDLSSIMGINDFRIGVSYYDQIKQVLN